MPSLSAEILMKNDFHSVLDWKYFVPNTNSYYSMIILSTVHFELQKL